MRLLQKYALESFRLALGIYISAAHHCQQELHTAYTEALEAAQYQTLIETADSIVFYDSLDLHMAQTRIKQSMDTLEARAADALRELRVCEAAEAVSGFAQELKVVEQFPFAQYRFIALKSRLAVVISESDSLDFEAEELQTWAKRILSSEMPDGIEDILTKFGNALGEKRRSCSREQRRYAEMLKIIEENFCDPCFSAGLLADDFSISLASVTRLFRKYGNCTFLDYLHGKRLKMGKKLLLSTDDTVADISQRVGYANAMTMIRAFKRYENTTPGKFRLENKKGKNS